MHRPLSALLLALSTLAASAAHAAPDADRAAAMRERMESMTPEQKAAMRDKMQERWQNMTPEQKAAARDKAKARWDAMTPEQQAEAKKRFGERHPEGREKMTERAGGK